MALVLIMTALISLLLADEKIKIIFFVITLILHLLLLFVCWFGIGKRPESVEELILNVLQAVFAVILYVSVFFDRIIIICISSILLIVLNLIRTKAD